MDINSLKAVDMSVSYPVNQPGSQQVSGATTSGATEAAVTKLSIAPKIKELDLVTGKEKLDDEKTPNKQEIDNITKAMNKFMDSLNSDLQFAIHERSQRLMVQMVNAKDNTVIKEFPPKEFLDMVAKIRDYVGAILDKRV